MHGKRAEREMARERLGKRYGLKYKGRVICISDSELHPDGSRESLKVFQGSKIRFSFSDYSGYCVESRLECGVLESWKALGRLLHDLGEGRWLK